MLEYLLTRPRERRELIGAARGLRFLVLDELHTYRGRQGADVAMLVRRLRDACQSPDLRCIGTSATMASGESQEDTKRDVAKAATRLFGADVRPEHVIGEHPRRATPAIEPSATGLRAALREALSSTRPRLRGASGGSAGELGRDDVRPAYRAGQRTAGPPATGPRTGRRASARGADRRDHPDLRGRRSSRSSPRAPAPMTR